MAWFVDWFDTEYYHILYKNRNEKEAKKFIQNLIKRHPLEFGSKIMDLACGKGRHAKIISELGFDVIGLDLSKKSINEAKKYQIKDQLCFDVHDMRLPYAKEQTFDAIFNLFTSFGYFDDPNDNKRVFDSIHLQLKWNAKDQSDQSLS